MGKDLDFDREAYQKFMKRQRPNHFYDPKFINLGITPGTTIKTQNRLKRAKPGNFFSQVIGSADESNLSKLFKEQADRLMDLQFDQYAQVNPKVFWAHINKLAGLVDSIKPRKDCLPFLIVISQFAINRQKQASRLGIDCADGSKFFAKGQLPDIDGMDRPELPYLAINVNLGTKFLGLAPSVARQKFNRWWRWRKLLPLTVDEGFALQAHCPELIKNNCLDLIGTQFGANGVASLIQRTDGPWIVRRPDDQGGIGRWPAYCYQRLAP